MGFSKVNESRKKASWEPHAALGAAVGNHCSTESFLDVQRQQEWLPLCVVDKWQLDSNV